MLIIPFPNDLRHVFHVKEGAGLQDQLLSLRCDDDGLHIINSALNCNPTTESNENNGLSRVIKE